ncbi:MAG: tRNA 2-thiouridine(34) synthase MnmA [Nanoarchaeota archaeon]|nr:tRNA 2-thiouridine(34) synthase MnmA [Nanoarchaeota archaeon]
MGQKISKQKVLLAMSGGVDSSVAALLLQKAGYEVYGAFMKNWSDTKNKLTGECSWVEERKHAIKIATKLGIPFITLDFEKEYKKLVVDEMFKKYKAGITPNPDIDCNEKIKFPLLIKAAKKAGIPLISTGHYARIKKKGKKYELHRAKDESKDQSYFLYRQSQDDLAHTLFPIGNLTKKEVRKIANKNGFENAQKKGTVGICFIGKVNLKEFLSRKIKPKKGKIIDPQGKIIGQHDGIYFYTIGQRLGPRYGFEVERKNPKTKRMNKWYVAKKDPKTNTLTAAPEGHPILLRKEIFVNNLHLIDTKKKDLPKKVFSRIRQVGELLPSKLNFEKGKLKVTLEKGITGVSEGQAIVLYKETKCLGGGVISFQIPLLNSS